ncbi:MAG TPA: hypothetical protein VGE98_07380 [Thermoanaerobaculia bacterium]
MSRAGRGGRALLPLLAALLTCAAPAVPSTPSAPVDHYRRLQEARALLDQRRFAAAAPLFRRLSNDDPLDGDLWLGLAQSEDGLDHRKEAIAAYEKALEQGAGFRPENEYRVAQLHAELGERDAAFAWVEKALADRLGDRGRLRDDDAFRAFRGDERFARLAGLPPARRLSREEGWRFDLGFLAQEVARLHVALGAPAVPPGWDAALDRLRADLPRLSDIKVQVEIQRLLVMLGDGHTSLRAEEGGGARLSRLPIELYQFHDGLFVVGASGDSRPLVGSRVVRFGERGAEEAQQAIAAFIPHDNPMGVAWRGPAYLTVPAYLQAIGAASSADAATLTVRDRQGKERTVALRAGDHPAPWKLRPPGGGPPPLYLQHAGAAYWMQPLPAVHALYVQYNQVLDGGAETIAQFASRLERALRAPGVHNLIVDIRLNNGGNSYLSAPLIEAIAAFEPLAPGRRLFVLAGRGTFSAGQNFANALERRTQAIFVGEPTGSRPNFVGETTEVIFPWSGLVASVSNKLHQGSYPEDRRIWIAPQIPVPLTSADYFANRDPALAAVLELIGRK